MVFTVPVEMFPSGPPEHLPKEAAVSLTGRGVHMSAGGYVPHLGVTQPEIFHLSCVLLDKEM